MRRRLLTPAFAAMRENCSEPGRPARLRRARIRRAWPFPAGIRKQGSHRVDVAVVGRAFDCTLRRGGPKPLDEAAT